MSIIHSLLMVTFPALVLYGAVSDARELRIPNWLSLAILAGFMPVAVLAGIGLEAIAWHFVAALVTLVVGFVLFAFGLFGGGDAKMMAASALWVGWPELWVFALLVVLIGGVLSLMVIVLRKGIGMWPDWLVRQAEGLFTPNKAVPYGIAIAAGALMMMSRMDVLPQSWRTIFALIIG
ncbi:prepilin peptidase [Pseudomonadota bacterium]